MAQTRDEERLANAPIGPLMLKLAVPAVAAQVINMLYNIVDRIYIGHIPEVGDIALTGVGVTFPVIMAISAFAALVSMGGAPRASIMLGKGRKEEAENMLPYIPEFLESRLEIQLEGKIFGIDLSPVPCNGKEGNWHYLAVC